MNELFYYVAGAIFVGLGIAVSIGLHEFGHMLPAKKFGVRVPRFMIGFGPTLFSRKRGETEYGLKLIPLGGYVTLLGMQPGDEEFADRKPPKNKLAAWYLRYVERYRAPSDLEAEESHRAFYKLTAGRKLVVMAGGPVANLVLGIIFSAVAISGIGFVSPSNIVDDVSACANVLDDAKCSADGETLAKEFGITKGDRIISIGGVKIERAEDVRPILEPLVGKSTTILLERDGKQLPLTVPVKNYRVYSHDIGDYEFRPYLGVYFGYERRRQGLDQVANYSAETLGATFAMIVQLPAQAVHTLAVIDGSEQRGTDGAISVVGIAKVAGDMAVSNGEEWIDTLAMWLMMLSSLNFALFAFNMIPVLPLDGGHIAAALYGRVKKSWFKLRGKGEPRPVDLALLGPLTMLGWVALTLMGILFIVADIVAPMNF